MKYGSNIILAGNLYWYVLSVSYSVMKCKAHFGSLYVGLSSLGVEFSQVGVFTYLHLVSIILYFRNESSYAKPEEIY